MKKILFLLLGLVAGILPSLAINNQTATIDGLLYLVDIDSPSTGASFYGPREYRAELIIPDSIQYQDVTYPVTGILYPGLLGLSYNYVSIPETVETIADRAFDGAKIRAMDYKAINARPSNPDDYYSGGCQINSLTIGEKVQNVEILNGVRSNKTIWLPHDMPKGFNRWGLEGIQYVPNSNYNHYKPEAIHVLPFLLSMFEVGGIKYVPNPTDRTCEAIDCDYRHSYAVNLNDTVSYRGIDLRLSKINEYLCCDNDSITAISVNTESLEIPIRAFGYCTRVHDVDVHCLGIGEYAFAITPSDLYSASLNVICQGNIDRYAFSHTGYTSVNVVCDSLGTGAFAHSTASSITVNCNSIGDQAFGSCRYLTTFVLPDSVTSLGEGVWNNCTRLKDITLGYGITNLPVSSFENCISLDSLTIPGNVVNICDSVFQGCTALAHVNIEDADSTLNITSSAPLFADCPLEDVYVGRNLAYAVNHSPFYANISLKLIEFKGDAKSISPRMLQGCTSLETVILGDSIKTIGEYAFNNCQALSDIQLGIGISAIPEGCFNGCSSLPSITVTPNITSIGDLAFQGCTSLERVIIENSDSTLHVNTTTPLFSGTGLKYVYVGRPLNYNVTADNPSPFYGNTSVETVIYDTPLSDITADMFHGCTSLQTVNLGNGVEKISAGAFSLCTSLQTFTCGANVDSIGDNAFANCTGLRSMTSLAAIPPACGTGALVDINKWDCVLHVPADYLDAYKEAPQWRDFFFIMGDADVSGIAAINDGTPDIPPTYYSIEGIRVEHPSHGIYIEVRGNQRRKVFFD